MVLGKALATVGVEAVVENIKDFQKGMGFMNDQLDKFSLKGSLLSKVFKPVNKVLGGFFESLKRIGEFVTAGLILRGIDKITEAIRNMTSALYDAAVEFQGLQIRLENFIAADLMAAGEVDNMADALSMAVEPAEELFIWIQKLAILTPFDSQDVADALTMAKAWGFNTEEAKNLVIQVSDFAAGMGLSGEAMDRVIKALGQMKSLGRVAGQELLQLANAGVPVADIMENIRLELGLSQEAFEDLRMEGGVSAEMFFAQWENLVNTRFIGSAERMSGTMQGVISNIKDLVNGLLGFNVVKPVLDVIAGRLNDILGSLTEGNRFEALRQNLEAIGLALSTVVEALFVQFLPGDADTIADAFVAFTTRIAVGITNIADALTELIVGNITFEDFIGTLVTTFGGDDSDVEKALSIWDTIERLIGRVKDIFNAFKEEGLMGGLEEMGVPEPVLNFIGMLIQALDNIIIFWQENKGDIKEIFKEVAEGLAETLGLTGSLPEGEASLLEVVGGLILGLSENLVENAPNIIQNLERVGDTITEDFLPAFREVSQWILDHKEEVFTFMKNFTAGVIAIKSAMLVAGTVALGFSAAFIAGVGAIVNFIPDAHSYFDRLRVNILRAIGINPKKMGEGYGAFSYWYHLGHNIVSGFFKGLVDAFFDKYFYAYTLFGWFISLVNDLFESFSPSRVFMRIGKSLMEGFAIGIEDSMIKPEMSMRTAVTHILQPATNPLQSGVTNNNQTVNNFNMNINTQAKAEPIVADFRMMESMAGAG